MRMPGGAGAPRSASPCTAANLRNVKQQWSISPNTLVHGGPLRPRDLGLQLDDHQRGGRRARRAPVAGGWGLFPPFFPHQARRCRRAIGGEKRLRLLSTTPADLNDALNSPQLPVSNRILCSFF
eukprot:gene13951-biopygen3561